MYIARLRLIAFSGAFGAFGAFGALSALGTLVALGAPGVFATTRAKRT